MKCKNKNDYMKAQQKKMNKLIKKPRRRSLGINLRVPGFTCPMNINPAPRSFTPGQLMR